MRRAIARGHEGCDSGSGAEIEESVAGTRLNEIEKERGVGDHRRIDEVFRRPALVTFDGAGPVGYDVQAAERVKDYGAGKKIGIRGVRGDQTQRRENVQRQSPCSIARE